MGIEGKSGFIQLQDGSAALDVLPPHPRFPKQLAKVFYGYFIDGPYGEPAPWLVRCEYCGACCLGESLEEAVRDFDKHMRFGFDSSKQHFEYAAGKRKRAISRAKTFKGLLRYDARQKALAGRDESRGVQ